jgi:hypothetical protein
MDWCMDIVSCRTLFPVSVSFFALGLQEYTKLEGGNSPTDDGLWLLPYIFRLTDSSVSGIKFFQVWSQEGTSPPLTAVKQMYWAANSLQGDPTKPIFGGIQYMNTAAMTRKQFGTHVSICNFGRSAVVAGTSVCTATCSQFTVCAGSAIVLIAEQLAVNLTDQRVFLFADMHKLRRSPSLRLVRYDALLRCNRSEQPVQRRSCDHWVPVVRRPAWRQHMRRLPAA